MACSTVNFTLPVGQRHSGLRGWGLGVGLHPHLVRTYFSRNPGDGEAMARKRPKELYKKQKKYKKKEEEEEEVCIPRDINSVWSVASDFSDAL